MSDWWSGLQALWATISSYIPDFIKQIGDALLGAIVSFFEAIGRGFASLFQAEVQIVAHLDSIATNFEITKANIGVLIEKIEQFNIEPTWSSRVINVPIAIKQMQELFHLVTDDFKQRIELIIEPIHQLKLIFRAEEVEANTPQGQVAGITKTAVKIDEIATMVAQIATAMETVKDFVDVANQVVDKLNGLDVIFLNQGTPRFKVQADWPDGSTRVLTLRDGSLHSGK